MRMRHVARCRRVLYGVLALLILAGSGVSKQVGAARLTHALISQPVANVAAFRGHGQLAFLWSSRLYVLDGATGVLRPLTRPAQITNLTWSPDGQWLAYIRVTNPYAEVGQLWLVRADGSHAHAVTDLPAPVSTAVWSPVRDVLAVTLSWTPQPAGLWVVTPMGRPYKVAVAGASVCWAPDSKTLAYSRTLPFHNPQTRSDALYTVPATGGAPTRRFVARSSGIVLAGWWPNGKGILFWRDPMHSASLAADGLELFTLPLSGRPHPLTLTLPYSHWLSWSPSGRTLVLVAGGGRENWHNKTLTTCDVHRAACRTLPQRPGVVALDPAWSPQGNRIAFVTARDLGLGCPNMPGLLPWVHSRTLWVADARGAGAHELHAAGGGVYAPEWSRNGRYLLYVGDNAVWLIRSSGGAPVKIVGPFPTPAGLLGYYGHVSWSGTLAWNRR